MNIFDVPDVLAKIKTYKIDEVQALKARTSLRELDASVKTQPLPRGFTNHIKSVSQQRPAIIAEIKKASPSKGIIRSDFDPVKIAQAYECAGAACLSVLTDAPGFMGSNAIFEHVRNVTKLPMLRKDFMLDPIQIVESRALGADAVLIILSMIDDICAKELIDTAKSLSMDALIETHDFNEIERALKLGSDLIGINNRNLRTFETRLDTFSELASQLPNDVIKVAESGIYTRNDILTLTHKGADAFLIGEALMRQDDIEYALKDLQGLT